MPHTDSISNAGSQMRISLGRIVATVVMVALCFFAARLIDVYHGSIEGDRVIEAINGSPHDKALALGIVQSQLSTWIRSIGIVGAAAIWMKPLWRVLSR